MNNEQLFSLFRPLWNDIRDEDEFDVKKPLLAHYTSVDVLEKILEKDEIWFSNPLYMNDIEEVRFGLSQGVPMVLQSPEIRAACKTKERADRFVASFSHCSNVFAAEHLLDTYVFCCSEHDVADYDGPLSMWRGYGSQGNGVAIVLDTAKIAKSDISAFALAKVFYGSGAERVAWLKKKIAEFAGILVAADLPDDSLYGAAHELFERIKSFALFTKHRGFLEECEWRAVYIRNRDPQKQLDSMFSYSIGPRGIEPRLKLKLAAAPGVTSADLSLAAIVDRIILGPSASSLLATATVGRMLERLGKGDLKQKLHASAIPFRVR
jgi:hypothetical protein